jgi:serine/threonine-protein kinase
MATELDATTDFVPAQQAQGTQDTIFLANSNPRSRVNVKAKSGYSLPSDQFVESTRKLLRERLLIAIAVLIAIIVSVKLIILVTGQATTRTFVNRLVTLVLLSVIWWVIKRAPSMSLGKLRLLELSVVFVPLLEVLLVQHYETIRLIEAGEVERVPVLLASLGAVVGLFIAIYGIFIPSNWRRTAAIALTAAILPTIVAFIQYQLVDELSTVASVGFATPTVLIMMACVATVGAHAVHTIRQEAESARQYGQYQLTEEIGRGGMGVVYRAEHRMLKRPAAIKLIRSECAADEQAIARFEQEVQLSATLSHWNTVQIYDYGRTAMGDFYYVMEYLEGKTLSDALKSGGKATPDVAVRILRQICDGLEEAHTKTMVHRDLKPDNIFVSDCGTQCYMVKILDFGLAGTKEESKRDRSVSGSPSYMSPEQIRGEQVDGRSDIYSLGCILFECLTGRALFYGETVSEVLNQHLNEHPNLQLGSDLNEDFASIVRRCVEKDNEDRFQDVSELREALNAVTLAVAA